MNDDRTDGDLFVLVADADARETMSALLRRSPDLGIRSISYRILRHPERDPGCRRRAAEALRPFLNHFRRALVVFDHAGCGSGESRRRVQEVVDEQLAVNGWKGRSRTIVIAPELEVWMWGRPAGWTERLGWKGSALRRFLERRRLGDPKQSKPEDPKRAFQLAVRNSPRRTGRSPSARLFGELATAAPLDGCRDPAFRELRETLRTWFPPEAP